MIRDNVKCLKDYNVNLNREAKDINLHKRI